MPEDIQEIPLDIAEEVQDNVEEIKADEQPEIEVTEPVKPKAKGRPRGSLNKGPSKPRAKKDTNNRDTGRGRFPSRARTLLSQKKSQDTN